MNECSPEVRNAEGVFIHCIVVNRHDGQSFFAIAPSAGNPHPPDPLLPRCGRRGSKRDANRHDGQSRFAIAPSAGSPSGDIPTRNLENHHIGQSRFSNALLAEAFFGHSYARPSILTQIDWFLRPLNLTSAGRPFFVPGCFHHLNISSYGVRNMRS